jgi:hypothetical protein
VPSQSSDEMKAKICELVYSRYIVDVLRQDLVSFMEDKHAASFRIDLGRDKNGDLFSVDLLLNRARPSLLDHKESQENGHEGISYFLTFEEWRTVIRALDIAALSYINSDNRGFAKTCRRLGELLSNGELEKLERGPK